jgi:CheY-like chemotaxis protein
MAKTILVADDNPRIRELLGRMLETEPEYDICAEASNGQEAIDLALKRHSDLIILDISMPVLDGLAASQELKKVMPDVPIILFTEYADLSNQLSRPVLHVDRIVSKSNGKELMGQVKSLIPV